MNAFLTLYRSFSRHPRFALLNLCGLALGIAVFLVLFLFVRFETSFDRTLPGSDEIWVVDRSFQFGAAPPVDIPSRFEMLPLMQSDYPGTQGARLISGKVTVHSGGRAVTEQLALADPSYFELFPLPAIAGSPQQALERPGDAVVTESFVQDYLRPGDPIGQTVDITLGEERRVLRVAAVIRDLPAAMSYRNDIFAHLTQAESDNPRFGGLVTFLRFATTEVAEARIADLDAFNRRHPDPNFSGPAADVVKITDRIIPLASVHLEEPRDRLVVATLGAVGLIALALAIVNYVNLSTARADLRAREVAMRKVLGARRGALIRQLMGESLAAACVAGLLGLALAEMALPIVNAAGGMELAIVYWGQDSILPPVLAVVLVTGLIAGIYPAFVISRFQPASVLVSTQSPGTGRRGKLLRSALVVGQFAIAIALMIGTGVLLAQARHLQTSDLGFQRDGLAVLPAFANQNLDPAQRAAIRRDIAALPGVAGTATSAVIPGGGSFSIINVSREGEERQFLEGLVGPQFLDVYGARLVAGRPFDPSRFPADIREPDPPPGPDGAIRRDFREHNAIVNRSAVRAFGFASPEAAVGQTLSGGGDGVTIVGVIDDLRFDDPRKAVQPQAYYLRMDNAFSAVLAVRYTGADQPLLAAIERIWHARAGAIPFDGLTANRSLYEKFYEADLQRSRLFTLGAVLAVAIGCLGLYGLAAFDTARRVREIGIRKALGASTRDIMGLLIGQFLRPVVIANLIAWPIAWLAMRRWLAGFDDRVALSPAFFAGASVLALLIAGATVFGQAWQVSRATPAKALRNE
ncbi:ABC transporter permease [Pelagerythrobacter sp.]|uniref:ABC transporter permease n=1 Tax=Pelagerythrobacter sp. TaxID=2800702 RepID=UPI0035B114EA